MNELGVITVLLATTQARLTRNGFKEILQNEKDDAAKNDLLNCWNDYTVTLDKLSAAHLPSNQKDYKAPKNIFKETKANKFVRMKDKKISVDWSSDLPKGILEMILEKLALSDYVSFGVEIHLPPMDENYRKLMFSKYPGDENCVYMLFTRLWSKSIFWTPGAQDWCELGADRYYDVTTELYEVRMPHELAIQEDEDISMSSRYLVELCGEYRFLRRKHDFHSSIRFETYDFKICKLDLSKKAWVALDSLGDYVLFVSRNCSRSILAKELGLGMANCIYFTYEYDEPLMNEWEFPQCREGSNQSDWVVFNLDKNHSKSFCPIETTLNRWPSTWITVPLWWYFQKKTPLFM
ncbi:hypothetical protein Patl1_24788 [Pistacia atlantica]|uniref:Uncharacterized protein n=1 Tax=Pistacia atlantica TaxID=434234 RepID=A0ACC1B1F4_9ROSI|nr:hypothetical protein Patl1_24788 [Pistacia atlantica]